MSKTAWWSAHFGDHLGDNVLSSPKLPPALFRHAEWDRCGRRGPYRALGGCARPKGHTGRHYVRGRTHILAVWP